MTVALTREVLGCSALINYAVLLWWFLVFCFARDWMYGLHSRWFRLTSERFDATHYAAMAVYKRGILDFLPRSQHGPAYRSMMIHDPRRSGSSALMATTVRMHR